jgi:peroxiredoxin
MGWQVAGTDTIGTSTCIRLVGLQKSDDWDRPRGDRTAWRRRETVWVSPRTGLAARVERIIEQREPARLEPTRKSTLRYDLESSLQYHSQLGDDRRVEITQALTFRDNAAPLLAQPARNAKLLAIQLRKIAYHLENQPPTPYREAVLQVKRQVEAASRGEVVPAAHQAGESTAPAVAALGQSAPDFVATSITAAGSARLASWKGKPIVLLFYHPGSVTATESLRFAQNLHSTYWRHAQVVALSVSDDKAAVLKQRDALKLTFPILHGGGLRISYAVETTPKIVLIDARGVVRGSYLGWGSETGEEVLTELRRWLPGQ